MERALIVCDLRTTGSRSAPRERKGKVLVGAREVQTIWQKSRKGGLLA